ncbi:FadD32-like long-chain-fatty-acid--AMP ligase [Corynebacterium bovis]|uniref:FadD32-like long-chain-fatty-acid--AMP ligase n=1 Tax=Corynebacterium bovis TaxID=36808 RepID=UPI00244D3B7A|nr:FadD32-like long-chain-fatty-acid--AMP ligase [Corynebacterium bovis]MDH2456324.1 FadD32-like long-chain-fatty-acid--AMP ligase [Corynebacterium bovis]
MDISAAMSRFFDDRGGIVVPDTLTLPGMCEMLYQAARADGEVDGTLLRFHDHSADREGTVREYTWAEVNTRIKAVAVRLAQITTPGERVAVLANNSPEYIFAFLGAMYAGTVPVPLYDPNEPGHADHLRAVLGAAAPTVVLTNRSSAAAVREHFADRPGPERPRILTVDALPDTLAAQWAPPGADAADAAGAAAGGSDGTPPRGPRSTDPAFLQFTSGSTRTPAGVMLTHRSIVTNVLQIFRAGQLETPLRLVSWLPLHHDMGIILAAFVTILGLPYDMMTPREFIQDPSRWIRQLHDRGDGLNVYTAVPNFALELAARYADPASDSTLADLDLGAVRGIINGAEPVSEQTIRRFDAVFGPYGLDRTTLRPSYGLAEASLLVTTPQTRNRPLAAWFDRAALSDGRAECVAADSDGAVPMMSVGSVCRPQELAVVDPATGEELRSGLVGEVWVHGDNMAAGYLDRPEETAATFRNSLPVDKRLAEGSTVADAPDDDRWMRTGDLGVLIDGELYVTGRLKDLVVVAGRNHYPQDIEATAEAATSQIQRGVLAAFAVPAGVAAGEGAGHGGGDDGTEQLVIVAERDPEADPAGDAEAVDAVRAAVTRTHGVTPRDVVVVDPGAIPRSSANKIARRVCARAYLDGRFRPGTGAA